MPESVSTCSAYKMLTCIYLCRTLLFFAPYADFYYINRGMESEINYEWFQNYLPSHEIELYIQNEHLFGSNSNRIVEVSINDSCIYKK